jgi:hypothetical protein
MEGMLSEYIMLHEMVHALNQTSVVVVVFTWSQHSSLKFTEAVVFVAVARLCGSGSTAVQPQHSSPSHSFLAYKIIRHYYTG